MARSSTTLLTGRTERSCSASMKLSTCSVLVALLAASGCSSGNGVQPSSGGDDAGDGAAADAGAPFGPDGGTLDSLVFAVAGDSRPPNPDDIGSYPTAIVDKIFADITAHRPQVPFVVSTGDYQFSYGSTAGAQLDLYLGARKQFPGPEFPAMGNHECTGATASNCGPGTHSGQTANYQAFMSKMLAPIGQTKPYYAIHVAAADGSWTAKFVFVAANAWTSDQGTWLDSAMSESTTYTFVVRHEPASATTAPGVTPSEQIMAKHPYTLAIVGHSHTYGRSSQREVIVGNGGAPLSSGSVDYGYALVQRRSDGAIQVDMIDYMTAQPVSGMGFAVKADGSPAP